MSGKKAPVPGGIVTSDAVYHGTLSRKMLIASLGLAGVVVLAVGVYVGAQRIGLIGVSANTQQPAEAPVQTVKAAQMAVAAATTPQQKAVAYNNLGDAYAATKQSSDAISAYNTAASDAQGASDTQTQEVSLSDLVDSYMLSGDTADEIKAIQALIPLYKQSTDPDAKRIAFRWQSLLENLQGGQ